MRVAEYRRKSKAKSSEELLTSDPGASFRKGVFPPNLRMPPAHLLRTLALGHVDGVLVLRDRLRFPHGGGSRGVHA